MSAIVLEAKNLARYYPVSQGFGQGKKYVKALNGVSFTLEAGKTLAVVGESGCGKSTLARQLTLIEQPTSGELLINGQGVTKLSGAQLKELRTEIQMVFQNPYASLNPRQKIGDQLAEPLLINTNLSGVFFGMQHQIKAMLRTGGGSIVNMASILGSVGFATAPAYTAAKHGVVGLTKAAAIEYSAHGVRINAVGPAFIHTPMISGLEQDAGINAMLVGAHPIGRLGQPEEVAELVTWLASSKASFVTGAYYPVDGGYLAR